MFSKIILLFVVSRVSAGSLSLPSLPQLPTQSNYIITMADSTSQILDTISNTEFATREDRLNAVTDALKSQAALSQGPLLSLLASKGLYVQSLWITNQVFVRGLLATILDLISARTDVIGINPEKYLNIGTGEYNLNPTSNAEWGIVKIQAPEASAISNGTRVRIASLDTGVRSTHEALSGNFIGQYGWYDPYDGSSVPSDTVGHGTMGMGIMVGKGIGVAQGAQWMTCKACKDANCALSAILLCTQWVLCPTLTDGSNSDCSKAPHIINLSLGGGQGDTSYDDAIKVLHSVGIIPVVSAGNSGPTCGTITSPADSEADVIAVGSTTNLDSIDPTSSKGPSFFGAIKPDISAPGFLTRSAYNTSDSQYAVGSGTSFAAPHVSGTIAIMLSANPTLTYDQVKQYLFEGVDTTLLSTNGLMQCGGIKGVRTYPNNEFGIGRVNALNSLNKALGN